MRVATRLLAAGVAVGMSGCVSGALSSTESRGTTAARFGGPLVLMFTNASPQRMCGLYMTDDNDDDYGDNWLPAAGVPSGGSVQFKVKPGKYKARWDTCREGDKPWYAATLWREAAVTVKRETQLYAYVADSVAPTSRAQVMGRDYSVVRFPGQAIESNPQAPRPQAQQVSLRASTDEPSQLAGFIGRVPISVEMVAARPPPPPADEERFDAKDFVDATVKPVDPKAKPKPSLNRKHELSNSSIEYKKR